MGSKARKVIPKEEEERVLKETKNHFTSGYFYQVSQYQ
jgi:hypothetical protein